VRGGGDYVIKRVLFAVVTVFVAISLNFVIFRAAPGDATTAMRCLGCTPQVREQVRVELGLDRSKWQQYVLYLEHLAHGDLGRSFQNRQPVLGQLWEPLLNTLPMILLGTVFSILFGILTGVVAAWRRGTSADTVSVWTGLAFYSLPTQWLGLMLILYLAGPLGLPTSGISDPYLAYLHAGWWPELIDRLKHMVLPALTLGLVLYGEYTLIVRSSMLETLGEDYVLTARAKGLSNWQIVRRHAFRNSLLPVTTLIFLSLGFITGGAILVEAVFSYPGIGLLTYQAVFAKDYTMLQGAFLVLTISVVLMNLIADLLYFRLDPRIVE
jgi:ABC-type dipeptide/oligopeptide/nickel transport system permease component